MITINTALLQPPLSPHRVKDKRRRNDYSSLRDKY